MTDQLTDFLGSAPPETVAALPEAVRDQLALWAVEAKQAREAEATEAVESAIDGVPLPLRGILRQALT